MGFKHLGVIGILDLNSCRGGNNASHVHRIGKTGKTLVRGSHKLQHWGQNELISNQWWASNHNFNFLDPLENIKVKIQLIRDHAKIQVVGWILTGIPINVYSYQPKSSFRLCWVKMYLGHSHLGSYSKNFITRNLQVYYLERIIVILKVKLVLKVTWFYYSTHM